MAAASEEPPPIPAATGIRLSIVSRCGGPSQPVCSRNSSSARPARFGPSTPGQMTSSRSAGSSVSSSASESAWTTETSGCSPSSRGVPTKRQRLTLAGARAWRVIAAPRTARAIAPARGSPPARRRGGRATRARRARASRSIPASASEPGSAFLRCAKPALTSARSSGSGGGADALQPDQHRVDVRDRVEHAPRHRAQDAHLARQLGEHGRRAVGGAARLRREPLADLALDHRDLGDDAGELLDHAQDHRRRHAVGEVGDDLGRGRLQARARSSRTASPKCSVAFGERVEGVAEGGLELAVDLDHVHVGDARRQVLAQHAEPAADLEHDVVLRQRRLAPDHAEQVRVDQEVLPQLAVGADAERLEAAQARLRREPAHQPNRRAAFASTACSSSS